MTKQHEAREERHRTRKDEIISAARHCFRQFGFHAASMAQLARGANLSVGQIYRYFPSKDALIEEMVKRIVDNKVAAMSDHFDAQHIATLLACRITLSEEDEMLMLEVAAEASRNPRVAEILSAADERIFSNACHNMQLNHPQLNEEQITARVEVLAVLVEGTAFRQLTPQKASATSLQSLYHALIHHIVKNSEDK